MRTGDGHPNVSFPGAALSGIFMSLDGQCESFMVRNGLCDSICPSTFPTAPTLDPPVFSIFFPNVGRNPNFP